MVYKTEFTPAAIRDLKRLPKGVQTTVVSAIGSLADNPRPHGYEKIEGSGDIYRIRCGDYRMLYRILDDVLTVVIVRTRHRREVYKHISQLEKRP